MNSENQLSRIRDRPTPLISLKDKYVVLWSAKSGCTFILKWFYMQNGISYNRQQDDFNGWHDHRVRGFYKSADYLEAIEQYVSQKYNFVHVKFIRNPYERAASAYLHLLKKAAENHPMAKDFLKVSDIKPDFKMSFKEFIAKLATKNVRQGNIHWRSQTHHLERAKKVKVAKLIYIEDSLAEIPKFESSLNLKVSNANVLNKLKNHAHHSKKASAKKAKSTTDENVFVGDIQFDKDITLSRPAYKDFFNAELEKEIYRIYQEDFKRYKITPNYIS